MSYRTAQTPSEAVSKILVFVDWLCFHKMKELGKRTPIEFVRLKLGMSPDSFHLAVLHSYARYVEKAHKR
jgi:hypothetical protein